MASLMLSRERKALDIGRRCPCDGHQTKIKKRDAQISREVSMLVRKAARLLGGLFAAVAALGMAVSAHAQEKKIKIGVIFDLTGPFAGGGSELQYIGAKIMLDQLRQGRRRGLQGRGGLCRRPEQARRRDQRGGAPARAGKGRHAAGLLLLGAVRAGGRARRAAEEVHVDHHLHFLRRVRRQELQIRLPSAGQPATSTA